MSMTDSDEVRSVRVAAVITPSLSERLDAFAAARRWKRSSAIEYMIERMLDAEGGDDSDSKTRPR
jgi:hypothetical protein